LFFPIEQGFFILAQADVALLRLPVRSQQCLYRSLRRLSLQLRAAVGDDW
jgi:hypothetical protein